MRALVVDDSKPVRSILGKMLRELEFEVTEAANGREAMDRLEQLGCVDVATVNWNMPVLDGLQFIRAVRADARFRDMRLLMVSSESNPAKVADAMRAGANAYLTKPLTKELLVEKLDAFGLISPKADSAQQRRTAAVRGRRVQRVLVVDDSVIIRRTLTKVLDADPGIQVAGTAADGRIALDSLAQLAPDVVLLDIEMPNMDGFETLKALRKTHAALPVIMFSSLTERGAAATLNALMLGANDYVPKPTNVSNFEVAQQCIREELVPKIKQFAARGGVYGASSSTAMGTSPSIALRPAPQTMVKLVVIGVSTGGPVALARLLPMLGADLPVPLVIVQHMPPVFTRHLADRLAHESQLPVREATEDEVLAPGVVYIAPGGFHMSVARQGNSLVARLNEDPPENSCRPAADVLFRAAAEVCGSGTLAVVLTGMGRDGLRGCEQIAAAGGQILVQDEATSVVWGMPGHVARAGLANAILPLDRLSSDIGRRVQHGRRRRTQEKTDG